MLDLKPTGRLLVLEDDSFKREEEFLMEVKTRRGPPYTSGLRSVDDSKH